MSLAGGGVERVRHLEVFLIRPTKYDDQGYLLRYWRNIVPSNSLACLHALTIAAEKSPALLGVRVRAHLCDEAVEKVPERRIRRFGRRRSTRVVVALVGVQTSQMPRAVDLARRLRHLGAIVLVGGFHVSGSVALAKEVPVDLRKFMAEGISLVVGEVEGTWATILRDAANGAPRPLYDSLAAKPELAAAPVPRLDRRLLRKFVYRRFATIDASRGCPFACSFCTIRNVHGHHVRARAARSIALAIEERYRELGITQYFFTDDDFCRSPGWRELLSELIRLRERCGVPLRFLMQVDALSHRVPDLVRMARDAGCFQVFIGLESLDPESLYAAGKRQNRVSLYAELVAEWRQAAVLTHVGYIVGFPRDTPASIRAAVELLKREVAPDLASFFVLSPLPGSEDYVALLRNGASLEADLNRYDTFQPVVEHPRMTRDEWCAAYADAWRTFYAPAYMAERLGAASPAQRTTLLQLYLWHRAAIAVDRCHPMLCGVFRLKPRMDRRPGTAIEGRLRHLRRRAPDIARAIAGYIGVLHELRFVWARAQAATEESPSATSLQYAGAGLWAELRSWLALIRALVGTGESGPPAHAPGYPPLVARSSSLRRHARTAIATAESATHTQANRSPTC